MKEEKEPEHIHIMASGENMYETYIKATNSLKSISKLIVIKDNPSDPEAKKAIEDSFYKVEERSKESNIDVIKIEFEEIGTNDIEIISEKIFKLKKDYEDAEFSFNITNGTKIIAIALYQSAVWIGGTAYYFPKDSRNPIIVSTSRLSVKDISKNNNLITVLRIISENNGTCSRKDIFRFLENGRYNTIRDTNTLKEKRKIKQGTLTSLIEKLMECGCISESYLNRKEKQYTITSSGKTIINYYSVK